MIYFRRFILAIPLVIVVVTSTLAGNWPQWRGPDGNSVSNETNLPVRWSEKEGLAWKTLLPGEGVSTPAIWGDAIFLTSQKDDSLLFQRIDKKDGKIVWTQEVGKGTMRRGSPRRRESTFHKLHNMASPSPVTDGERIVVHFGNGELAAYDFDGKKLWRRNLQDEHGKYTIWWGHANSPVLWKDLVITVCIQDTIADLEKEPAPSYVVAHDKRTGEQKWKTPRMTGSASEDGDSYTTPILRRTGDGEELIVTGANQIDAYDTATGKQLWFLTKIKGSRNISGPTLIQDMIYLAEGKRGAMLAVKLEGKGKLGTDAIVWKQESSTPDTPCPVAWKDLLFWITDDGIANCVDAKTGKPHWKERIGGDFKPSPLAADGKIYFLNLSGKCTVVRAAERFEILGENKVDDEISSSLAVSDGRLFLRGKKALYCIGGK